MKNLDQANKVEWVDISTNREALENYQLTYANALKSMHVYDKNNAELVDGIDAFLLLWWNLPYYRHLASVVRWSPFLQKALSKAYISLAKLRLKFNRHYSHKN